MFFLRLKEGLEIMVQGLRFRVQSLGLRALGLNPQALKPYSIYHPATLNPRKTKPQTPKPSGTAQVAFAQTPS